MTANKSFWVVHWSFKPFEFILQKPAYRVALRRAFLGPAPCIISSLVLPAPLGRMAESWGKRARSRVGSLSLNLAHFFNKAGSLPTMPTTYRPSQIV
ncbi:hypothetical protein K461DRAFT_94160 [Myriangium duriaei CBS 260.36]|uniref:Uncharacterized protein n=1 Tax=Myriangium duriaei CBS 260.36 TaxID=1168546 RepID=A0A9P4JCF7_9PEZI|nr:hypothetical protein K461DRAFT_94160 [Myriangium duriaei CBS 260.36]